jgi:hypothetical protein
VQKIFRTLLGVSAASSLAVGAVIFYADLRAPRGLEVGALYVLPLLISLMADSRRVTLWLAALFSVMVVVGYAFSPDVGVPRWIVVSDRIVILLAIWVTGVLGVEVTLAKRQLREMGRLLTICMWTKQVRIDGEWISIERYLTEHCGIRLTHGISREAAEKVLREEGLEGR